MRSNCAPEGVRERIQTEIFGLLRFAWRGLLWPGNNTGLHVRDGARLRLRDRTLLRLRYCAVLRPRRCALLRSCDRAVIGPRGWTLLR